MSFIDVLGTAAILLISYGAWLAYRPAGFMVAGVLLLAVTLFAARGANVEGGGRQ